MQALASLIAVSAALVLGSPAPGVASANLSEDFDPAVAPGQLFVP